MKVHEPGTSHAAGVIGVALEEITEGAQSSEFEAVELPDGRILRLPKRNYLLTRELDGKVLKQATAASLEEAVSTLFSMLEEDVVWICTCGCSDDVDTIIHAALSVTEYAEREPEH
jgi:hypothetical protein